MWVSWSSWKKLLICIFIHWFSSLKKPSHSMGRRSSRSYSISGIGSSMFLESLSHHTNWICIKISVPSLINYTAFFSFLNYFFSFYSPYSVYHTLYHFFLLIIVNPSLMLNEHIQPFSLCSVIVILQDCNLWLFNLYRFLFLLLLLLPEYIWKCSSE